MGDSIMKKKFTIEWVSILIIFVFAFSAMIEIIYYVKDKIISEYGGKNDC